MPQGLVLKAADSAPPAVQLVSAVTVLPLYPALMAAEMATVLDNTSGGRFNRGVGDGRAGDSRRGVVLFVCCGI